jgi:hypothetical protein
MVRITRSCLIRRSRWTLPSCDLRLANLGVDEALVDGTEGEAGVVALRARIVRSAIERDESKTMGWARVLDEKTQGLDTCGIADVHGQSTLAV